MNKILGSQFEASLRILLLLEAVQNEPLSEGAIAALDYITVYSHDFGISESNLHGENKYRFGEFASRRATLRTAIKQLVLDRLVMVMLSSSGFHYKLSSEGVDFSSNLNTEYADIYYQTATQVLAIVGMSERTLGKLINQKSIASIRED
ncbi:hypothetical protein B1774_04590 [Dehalococcoides mccartyi]|uniref:ABC-three component system middle component 2 n=1 Tax=Dehalococcoides mccartyi TaxID=61435 RepID=UPI00098E93EF|nr:ABC-three component system middle component 2 [Dehalococcoides mccartyi]AQU03378.1 hypothetical protein B1773_04945 [Dehalococcoides mccartyi]AQU04675.1 hypothetical protein B1774_04590 [Dehalococcoides mccartyi]